MLLETKNESTVKWRSKLYLLVFLILFFSDKSLAITIQYEIFPVGGNSYKYTYDVTNDGSFGIGVPLESFQILFPATLYQESSLTIVTADPPASDWDEILLASGVAVDAAYDALALAGGIPDGQTVSGFVVEFVWLGGTPGPKAQTFVVYDPIAFGPVETGGTTAIPEPGTLLLVASGVLGLTRLRKRESQS